MVEHLSRRRRARLRDARGSTIVEAALITPLLLLLSLSVVDFGTLMYVYLALENGVSQATRYAITGNVLPDPNNPGSNLSRDGSIKATMRTATPTLTINDSAFTFAYRTPGGASWQGGVGGPGDIQKVNVQYTWTFFDPLMWAMFPNGQVNIQVESAMKNESLFQ